MAEYTISEVRDCNAGVALYLRKDLVQIHKSQ